MSESYSDSDSSSCCSTGSDDAAAASAELKLYRAFIFSVPVFFTLILLFLFYVFYLRPRRVDWDSLRMRSSISVSQDNENDNANAISTNGACLGLKKEFREMLPIIVYKESFSVNDTQCSVCLLDYQAEDRLQQIPACGHTFHMSCIDLWLSSHNTCPLCRLSLTAKSSTQTISNVQSNEEVVMSQSNDETQTVEYSDPRSTRHIETTTLQNVSVQIEVGAHYIDVEG